MLNRLAIFPLKKIKPNSSHISGLASPIFSLISAATAHVLLHCQIYLPLQLRSPFHHSSNSSQLLRPHSLRIARCFCRWLPMLGFLFLFCPLLSFVHQLIMSAYCSCLNAPFPAKWLGLGLLINWMTVYLCIHYAILTTKILYQSVIFLDMRY